MNDALTKLSELTSHLFMDAKQRKALLIQAFGDAPIVSQLDLSGDAHTFLVLTCFELHRFGEESLAKFLRVISGRVGDEKRAQIETLIDETKAFFAKRSASTLIPQEISPIDLKILKEIWKYLKYSIVKHLYVGWQEGRLNGKFLSHFLDYQELRSDPKYELADEEIESFIQRFDKQLELVLRASSIHLTSIGGGMIQADYQQVRYSLSEQKREQYEEFLSTEVNQFWESYQNILALLKKRKVWQAIVWDEETK